MNRKTKLYLLLIVIGQILFFSGWYVYNYYVLYLDPSTKSILLEAELYDSRNLLSGRYFSIYYNFANRNNWKTLPRLQYNPNYPIIYVVFQQQGQYYQAQYLTSKLPTQLQEQQVFVRGRMFLGKFKMNAEKYFVNEHFKKSKYRSTAAIRLFVTQTGRAIPQEILINDIN